MQLSELLLLNDRIDIYGEIRNYVLRGGAVYVWGTGSVAAGVLKECRKQGINIEGFFVDTETYNVDSRIGNEPIYQLQELLSTKSSFAVIVGHSHYELAANFAAHPKIEKTWCLVDVPRNDAAITKQFYMDNEEAFDYTYKKLADELSRRNMIAYLNAKITGDGNHVLNVFESSSTYFNNDIIKLSSNEVYFDVGAYDGKSVHEFIDSCLSYKKIVAIEVQPDMAEELRMKYANNPKIIVENVGISDYEGKARFIFDDQSTCLSDTEKGVEVEVVSLDYLYSAYPPVTTMKICIGNSITPVLRGAKKILCECKPQIVIAAGIDSRTLIDYIPLIESFSGDSYRYYLRFTNAMTGALVLFASPV